MFLIVAALDHCLYSTMLSSSTFRKFHLGVEKTCFLQ